MKTTKSTKALVTLLVVIILLALVGNYLGSSNSDNDSNSATVSTSVAKPTLFSTVRGWFAAPIKKPIQAPTSSTECWEEAVGDVGGIQTDYHSFDNCTAWADQTQSYCHQCCLGYSGDNIDTLYSCLRGCARDATTFVQGVCCADYSHSTSGRCSGNNGHLAPMQPIPADDVSR